MDIAIDFDGTCVTHEYPLIGRDAALGCPLIQPAYPEERPYADWNKIRGWLLSNGIL
jgi:hypothetical protein